IERYRLSKLETGVLVFEYPSAATPLDGECRTVSAVRLVCAALVVGAPGILNCRGLRMNDARPLTRSRWCIVVADAAGPEWLRSCNPHAHWAPGQGCNFGVPTPMPQKAPPPAPHKDPTTSSPLASPAATRAR